MTAFEPFNIPAGQRSKPTAKRGGGGNSQTPRSVIAPRRQPQRGSVQSQVAPTNDATQGHNTDANERDGITPFPPSHLTLAHFSVDEMRELQREHEASLEAAKSLETANKSLEAAKTALEGSFLLAVSISFN